MDSRTSVLTSAIWAWRCSAHSALSWLRNSALTTYDSKGDKGDKNDKTIEER